MPLETVALLSNDPPVGRPIPAARTIRSTQLEITAPAASKLTVLIRLNHDLVDGLSGADAPNPQP